MKFSKHALAGALYGLSLSQAVHGERGSVGNALFSVAAALQLQKSKAQKEILSWNKDNVNVPAGPFTEEEVYESIVYTTIEKTVTNGGVVWVESDVQTPGMKVVTDGAGVQSCLMTAGFDPESPSEEKQCNDGFQTSKRAKVVSRNLDGPIDLVFDVGTMTPTDPAYRFFLKKYENLSNSRIKAFSIQLGTEIDAAFVESSDLTFTNSAGTTPIDDVVDPGDIDLAAVFAFGLFGDADLNFNQVLDGYYDPTARGTIMGVPTPESNFIQFDNVSDNVAELYGAEVGSWLPKVLSPIGFFFDEDNDPDTDAILVADWDGEKWLSRRLCDDVIAVAAGLGPDGSNECRVDANSAPVPISDETICEWVSSPLYSSDAIEDFGNINVNTHIVVGPNYLEDTFTIRITPTEDDATYIDPVPWLANPPFLCEEPEKPPKKKKKSACFSPSNTVETSQGQVSMDQLAIGDVVRSGKDEFSRVIGFLHFDHDAEAEFLQIHSDKLKAPLEITPEHMVYVNAASGPVPASQIKVGDMLENSKVGKIKSVKRRGVYAPITESGDIVVNGVLASSYAAVRSYTPINQHTEAHAFFAARRLVCGINFDICKGETYTDGFPNWLSPMIHFALSTGESPLLQAGASVVGLPFVAAAYSFEQFMMYAPFLVSTFSVGYFAYKKTSKIKEL